MTIHIMGWAIVGQINNAASAESKITIEMEGQ
jgi:hypothetical protein